MASYRRLLLVALAGLIVAACGSFNVTTSRHRIGSAPYKAGSGRVSTQSRTLADFHAVSASSGMTVFVSRQSGGNAVTVTADDNLFDNVTTDVRDGTLVVTVTGSVETANELRVDVRMAASPDSIVVDEGSTLDVEDLDGTSLDARAGTGSTLRAGGKVSSLSVASDTGSTADLRNVESATATVTVSTGSTAFVKAKTSVGGTCTTGSTLHVTGGAAVQVSADTSSTVKQE